MLLLALTSLHSISYTVPGNDANSVLHAVSYCLKLLFLVPVILYHFEIVHCPVMIWVKF